MAPAPLFLHGYRGRMDERTDLVRSVTDGRFVYIRNYRPDLPAGQYLDFQMQTATTRVWRAHFESGAAAPAQAAFWLPHPPEELYDLATDIGELRNLAVDYPEVVDRLTRMLENDVARGRSTPGLGTSNDVPVELRKAQR